MLTTVRAGAYQLSGVSVGGVYTSLAVQGLNVVFDVGLAPRSFVGASHVLLSHGHADHIGALPALIGMRGLAHLPAPTVILPREIHADVALAIEALNRTQRRPLAVPWVPMSPGDEYLLAGDLWVRALRTLHSVPSLGYLLFRRVQKLKPEFLHLPPQDIGTRRQAGEDLFRTEERLELAYVTDSLIDVLDAHPELLRARTLILECTFLDERKSRADARAKYHVHLDEVVERAEAFKNESIVLMHFSQFYSPAQVRDILSRQLPTSLASKVVPFAPARGQWPG